MSVLSLLLLAWVRFGLPDFSGQSSRRQLSLKRIALIPGLRPVLLVLFSWIRAHNILYTYIAPFLDSIRLGHRVDAMLLLFGISSFAGIWLTGLLIDRCLRALTLVSLTVFILAALLLGFAQGSVIFVLAGILLWGLTFGGGPTLLQTALADTAGKEADVAMSMFVTVFNLAVAGGGVMGSLLLEYLETTAYPWSLMMLSLLALILVWSAKSQAFRPSHRTPTT